ncbi:glycosyltransferase family 2 protein [Luteimonas vadosa]
MTRANQGADPLARMSIVVPVGPGDTTWPPLLAALRRDAPGAQLIPVFAEGDPQQSPADALRAPAGRARQQNAGASAATRDWLWFVHADTRLAPDALPALRDWLAQAPAALGWFRLRFADDGPPAMRWNARGANWRARVLGLPFGDQGLLLPRAAFLALGGFNPALDSGEDHALVWAARRAGLPLRAIDADLLTSARKYAMHGWLPTTLHHLRLTVAQAWREARRR